MTIVDRILKQFGYRRQNVDERPHRSKHFDAARTTPDNRRHWANADNLAADAAANHEVRSVLRSRGRYEQFNNPYTDGMLQTLASDTVGRVPHLRMTSSDAAMNSFVEREVNDWIEACAIGEKTRIAVETAAATGEAFGKFQSNPKLLAPVKLDVVLLEGDQVSSPDVWRQPNDDRRTDGIVFDRYNNPVEYHVLRQHPGDSRYLGSGAFGDYDRIPAEDMLHLFVIRRPGQRRGIPRTTSSLPLFAERRGFRQSVLAAARKCAELGAIVLETDASANDDDDALEGTPFEEMEISSGMMTTLPAGVKGKQLDPTQPSTTYGEFDDRSINESARPLNMPFNIAACNSSKYNYASGRLDHQTYDLCNDVARYDLSLKWLDRILRRWVDVAVRVPGYLREPWKRELMRRIPHTWLWRGRKHVDPVKEATAARVRLETLTSTLSDELADAGRDFEAHMSQLDREASLKGKLRLTHTKPLTGPQVTAAIQVVEKVAIGAIPPVAAVELLISLGVSKEWAIIIVGRTTIKPAASTPKPDADPDKPAGELDACSDPLFRRNFDAATKLIFNGAGHAH